jgi:membrane fusion protein (multidrug efflux system)
VGGVYATLVFESSNFYVACLLLGKRTLIMLKSHPRYSVRSSFFVPLTVGGALLLGLVGCDTPAPAVKPPAPEVKVIKVEPKTIDVVLPRLAQLESSREVDVVARVSGFLEKMVYKEGALLKQGEVMFVMDKRPFQAQVDAAKGELQASKARLWTANANLKRVKPLTEADAMSQSDLDNAIGQQRSAEAAVFSAKAKLSSAELDLSYTTLYAPVTGLSGAALQREGSYLNAVSQSALLSYVAQIDPIWVNFAISQNELERFRKQEESGQYVAPKNKKYIFEIILTDGSVYPLKGSLDFASPTFDTRTGTFSLRAVVANPDFLLRPGMFVNSNLLGGKRPNAIVVPQQAVQQQGNEQVVMLVNARSEVEVRSVMVGDWIKDQWIINSGLKGGEMVIVEGFQKVRPKMTVKALHYIPKPASDASNLTDHVIAVRLAAN